MKRSVLLVLFLILIFTIPLIAADDWTLKISSGPSARYHHGTAYIGGDNIVIFGGWNSSYNNLSDTRVYDLSDNNWTLKSPVGGVKPSARHASAMAYIGGDNVLLFGGNDGSTDDETWIYNLTANTWTLKTPVGGVKPTARELHAMSYIGGGKVLLFGGSDATIYSDTWVYDLNSNTWENKDPGSWVAGTDMPLERRVHDIAYLGNNKVLLFGGSTPTTTSETWVYDLNTNTWEDKNPGTWVAGTDMPSARSAHSMAYMGNDNVLLTGGSNWNSDTWIYDLGANEWHKDPNTPTPPGPVGRSKPGLAETNINGTGYIVLFGGSSTSPSWPTDTWTFGGADYPLSIPPANGDGSSGNPYQIAVLNDLYWLSQQGGVVNATSLYWDKHYIQTADIDASATANWDDGDGGTRDGFSPIGNSTDGFTGSYNGDGYTIDGLSINRVGSSSIGFLGTIDGGTAINIILTNSSIIGGAGTGALSGYASGATITNCRNSGSVNGTAYTGNLVGHAYASNISYCSGGGTVVGTDWVGGLVGYNSGSSAVLNCNSSAAVSCTSAGGGLVGNNEDTPIDNCYSTGNVTYSTGNTSTSFGAFCGSNNSNISYCYTTGSVYYNDVADPTDKGFVGADLSGIYSNNFWGGESNQTTAVGATELSFSEMRDHTNFTAAGWDFEAEEANGTNDYWDIDYSPEEDDRSKILSPASTMAINGGRPFLSWENGEDVALPVELTSFSATATLAGVELAWTTESEIDNLGFLLERKIEGTNWVEIASYKTDNGLKGQGTISSPTDYFFLDKLVSTNITYEYRLADIDNNGTITYHTTRTVKVDQAPLSSKVEMFTVLPAYPNPFNPSTTISYGLDTANRVEVQIFDITGKLITTLTNKEQIQGWHSVIWNGTNQHGKNVPAGLYLSRITAGNNVKTSKLMLLK